MGNAIQWGLLLREVGLLLGGSLLAVAALRFDFAHTAVLVALIGTVQFGFYLFTTFRRVFNHINGDDMSIRNCLVSLGVMVSFFVVAYGVNYCTLTLADGDALKNFNPPSLFYRLVDGLYFSTVTFTATGFGEFVPATYPAKVLVWSEMVLGFATTVFAVSSFISLTDKN
ncbi:hypothetical protein LEM8419_03463 [Neolewinella maritima]|uniref:Potassium channel domain-containing protein n=1 Tax=Neolewinella maritima TaxID=1383882 RepID=A0ABN8F960_9BACT|nr:ion channel [Neolewinella maritima]CAH1002589.1 hypothetical protein LEM8419_03463 [Neolewinella maritima]